MDWLEERLADRRYLMGDTITEADVRLFTTLVRFDAVYHGHFKCNRNKLTEMPHLWGYARDLFQTPGFGDEVDFDQIKQHYYVVHTDINPTQIVPAGPDASGWLTPHGRGWAPRARAAARAAASTPAPGRSGRAPARSPSTGAGRRTAPGDRGARRRRGRSTTPRRGR